MATKFEYYTTGCDTPLVNNYLGWLGQTLTPSVSHKITSVKLLLHKSGSPGTLTVGIRAVDGEGLPTGDDLCSGTTDGDTLTTDTGGEVREITFGAGTSLTASTQYAIIIRTPLAPGESRVKWLSDISSPGYTGGNSVFSNNFGVTWTYVPYDSYFEDWGYAEHAISASISLGLAPTVSRVIAVNRTATPTSGRTVTATRATAVSRAASVALGLVGTTLVESQIGAYLCVASQNWGSIKTTSNIGDSWTVCAKTAAGTMDAAWFAQYDNRLCVLNYLNSGFSYSSVNDIAANWTNKPYFPNLPIRFTGMFEGKDASDNAILYFLTQKGMYYLDVFSNFVFGATEVSWEEDSTSGKKGLYWKGDNYVAIGKGIYKVSQGVVTLVGPDMDDGLPEDMQGTVTDMIGVGFWLVIAVDGGTGNKSSILKRYISGKHWHPVYVSAVGSRIKSLCWDNGTLYFGEGTNVKSLAFPATTDNVNALSTQTRVASGTLVYPWFHSVFETMSKTAFKVWATTKNCTADETITIHYRKNEETSWTSLGSFATSPRPTALAFGTAGVGVEFERIQLRASYARGATTTNSPKIESLVLEYQVNPPTLWSWTMKVMATTSKDQKGLTIIAALKTALETNTLLAFYPDGDKSGTVYYVRVKGMPGGEKGTEFGQEGLYQLTVSETVG